MICPHCRFEILNFPCSQCGWEAVQSFAWAAQEAEKAERYETAFGHWRQAVRWSPEDRELNRRMSSCLSKWVIRSNSMARFEEATSFLTSWLEKDDHWDDGHQLRIILYDRFGKLADLQRVYESAGESGKRWIEVIRLIGRFRDEGVPIKALDEFKRDSREGWIRLVFLVLGLAMTFWGSIWFRHSFQENRALFAPVFLIVFGIVLASGSAVFNWNEKRKRPPNQKASTPS